MTNFWLLSLRTSCLLLRRHLHLQTEASRAVFLKGFLSVFLTCPEVLKTLCSFRFRASLKSTSNICTLIYLFLEEEALVEIVLHLLCRVILGSSLHVGTFLHLFCNFFCFFSGRRAWNSLRRSHLCRNRITLPQVRGLISWVSRLPVTATVA